LVSSCGHSISHYHLLTYLQFLCGGCQIFHD
jgi:hypothetical protein